VTVAKAKGALLWLKGVVVKLSPGVGGVSAKLSKRWYRPCRVSKQERSRATAREGAKARKARDGLSLMAERRSSRRGQGVAWRGVAARRGCDLATAPSGVEVEGIGFVEREENSLRRVMQRSVEHGCVSDGRRI
jgi:hypothetical protein